VDEEPLTVADKLVQVNVPVVVAEAFGITVLLVTLTVCVETQPESVALTVYVPGALTVAGFAALLTLPPFQTRVPEGALAFKETVGVLQVIICAAGGVITGVGNTTI
jgi:hypothetical protein